MKASARCRASGAGRSCEDREVNASAGFTLVEMLFVLALLGTVGSMAVPAAQGGLDELRTRTAARYLAGRMAAMRMDAVKRSTCLGLRFVPRGSDYRYTLYMDGNGNGIRSADIAAGVDAGAGPAEGMADKFPGVTLGLIAGYPDADGVGGTGSDGVRIGSARILTLSPDGTATAGTLYLHGRRSQFAVRILGTTGRVRVLQYLAASGTWVGR